MSVPFKQNAPTVDLTRPGSVSWLVPLSFANPPELLWGTACISSSCKSPSALAMAARIKEETGLEV